MPKVVAPSHQPRHTRIGPMRSAGPGQDQRARHRQHGKAQGAQLAVRSAPPARPASPDRAPQSPAFPPRPGTTAPRIPRPPAAGSSARPESPRQRPAQRAALTRSRNSSAAPAITTSGVACRIAEALDKRRQRHRQRIEQPPRDFGRRPHQHHRRQHRARQWPLRRAAATSRQRPPCRTGPSRSSPAPAADAGPRP